LHSPVEKAHALHSKTPKSLSPIAFIPSSYLGFQVPCVIHHLKLILIVESSSSVLITLGALLLDG
jgi:hypothetical protein